jgi:transketolase
MTQTDTKHASKLSRSELDLLCINTLRFLAVDMVQKAKSGHPGLPLGSATMAYTLFDRFLKVNPLDPEWPDRDRFVLSAGHGSALLYALLHMSGFDLPLTEIKRFREWGSATPGHPEYGKAAGVEATTGPLGQGFGNAVGMAIAEASLAARFNRPDHAVVDHYTYVLMSDGDAMEGVASEAASLAGHLRLGKLIALYADNHISLSGGTDLIFTEDRVARFAAYGWHTQFVEDSNDGDAIAAAIQAAKDEKDRPSFIAVRTHIGYGSPDKHDTSAAHGEPLGADEVRLTKENLGWPVEPSFCIPSQAKEHFAALAKRGATRQAQWESEFVKYSTKYPELALDFQRVTNQQRKENWDKGLPTFSSANGALSTRVASGKVLNFLATRLPEMMGGDADLAPSTHTLIAGSDNFEPGTRAGRNLRFGVREHAMGAILNGMTLHRGFIAYGATFLIFSDYMRPPMRLAAMNGLPVIYVFTHDSIAMGQDGPTHQPVEQLLGLRSVPGLTVIRPADANETAVAWWMAVKAVDHPTALILTRQELPVLDLDKYPAISSGVKRGGYILADAGADVRPEIILIATGSEIHLALNSRDRLVEEGVKVRVVSLPCWSVFVSQPESYRKEVLPDGIPLLSIEAGVSLGWRSYLESPDNFVAVDHYGASAPGEVVMREYGFTVENVCQKALKIIHSDKAELKKNDKAKTNHQAKH